MRTRDDEGIGTLNVPIPSSSPCKTDPSVPPPIPGGRALHQRIGRGCRESGFGGVRGAVVHNCGWVWTSYVDNRVKPGQGGWRRGLWGLCDCWGRGSGRRWTRMEQGDPPVSRRLPLRRSTSQRGPSRRPGSESRVHKGQVRAESVLHRVRRDESVLRRVRCGEGPLQPPLRLPRTCSPSTPSPPTSPPPRSVRPRAGHGGTRASAARRPSRWRSSARTGCRPAVTRSAPKARR